VGGGVPVSEPVTLTEREIDSICWLVGYVTKYRQGIEGMLYYAARDYDAELDGRRKAVEAAKAAGAHCIREYLRWRGKLPDSVRADTRPYGAAGAFRGEVRFYVRFGGAVHIFEEAGDRRGRYLGEFTADELEGGAP
jgi:hypothetical protein